MKRKALGKGLSALLPDPEPAPAPAIDRASEAPVASLEPNPFQPRSAVDPARLSELTASIRESGMVQPILVRRHGERYQIIAGERRWRAAQQAGLATVPIVVRDVADDRLLELALVENIQRQELTPLEEAQAFHRLQEELRLTQEEVARKVGRDRTTVTNTLRLLRLPREVRELLNTGGLDAGHGRALLALDKAEEQIALAREAARKGLSVREVERRVALLRAPRTRTPPTRDANTRAAEERLRAVLGTRVQITRRGRGGQVRIAFATEAELNRLFELLVRPGRPRPS
ncbi:MAG TPA: ParB/RepB/Spo0J family partition protein [Vicinamibacteria bacterium]|nr:ParB/RepB/Spo0J family partition protein [Vicinamibacteria bacterium]